MRDSAGSRRVPALAVLQTRLGLALSELRTYEHIDTRRPSEKKLSIRHLLHWPLPAGATTQTLSAHCFDWALPKSQHLGAFSPTTLVKTSAAITKRDYPAVCQTQLLTRFLANATVAADE